MYVFSKLVLEVATLMSSEWYTKVRNKSFTNIIKKKTYSIIGSNYFNLFAKYTYVVCILP